jgi:hypothetical protein
LTRFRGRLQALWPETTPSSGALSSLVRVNHGFQCRRRILRKQVTPGPESPESTQRFRMLRPKSGQQADYKSARPRPMRVSVPFTVEYGLKIREDVTLPATVFSQFYARLRDCSRRNRGLYISRSPCVADPPPTDSASQGSPHGSARRPDSRVRGRCRMATEFCALEGIAPNGERPAHCGRRHSSWIRPNGLPSGSRQTAHRSPGWMISPPFVRTRSRASLSSGTER